MACASRARWYFQASRMSSSGPNVSAHTSSFAAAGKRCGLTSVHQRWTASTVKPTTLRSAPTRIQRAASSSPPAASRGSASRGPVSSLLLLARTLITGWPPAPKAAAASLRQRNWACNSARLRWLAERARPLAQ